MDQVLEQPEEMRFLAGIREMLPPGISFLFHVDVTGLEDTYATPTAASDTATSLNFPKEKPSEAYDSASSVAEFTAIKQIV